MIVLDTHVLVWWASGDSERLSKAAHEAIENELNAGEILVSSISSWEIAMLVANGRLLLTMDVLTWLNTVSQLDPIRFVAVDNEIGVKSTELPGEFHKDPADRLLWRRPGSLLPH